MDQPADFTIYNIKMRLSNVENRISGSGHPYDFYHFIVDKTNNETFKRIKQDNKNIKMPFFKNETGDYILKVFGDRVSNASKMKVAEQCSCDIHFFFDCIYDFGVQRLCNVSHVAID